MFPLGVLQVSCKLAYLHPCGKRRSEEIILSLYLYREAITETKVVTLSLLIKAIALLCKKHRQGKADCRLSTRPKVSTDIELIAKHTPLVCFSLPQNSFRARILTRKHLSYNTHS